jgi:glutathione synthase/RimK-type ligase-like ATP-grasp enzyme
MTEFETDKMKRLKAQRAAIDARLRQEQYKLNKQERAKDTRRKVLVGAAMTEWAKRSNENSLTLDTELKHFLTRNDERELFGLPPLPIAKEHSSH